LEREAFLEVLAGPLRDVADAAGGELLEVTAGGARPPELAAALLRELRPAPDTVLVLEDLHRADEGTLDAPPLSADAVRALPEPHGVDGDDLHRRTGGNPSTITCRRSSPSSTRRAGRARSRRWDR
jgi:hypothetical protein